MKARKVRGLDPDGPLGPAALRIVEARTAELLALGALAADGGETEALHDTRIAAKRLRYVLEATQPCFGAPAGRGVRSARGLQDALGDLHDCDELLARLRAHGRTLGPRARARRAGVTELRAAVAARAEQLRARFEHEWPAVAARELEPLGGRLAAALKGSRGRPRRRKQAPGRAGGSVLA